MRPLVPPPVQALLALLCLWALHHFLPRYTIDFPGQETIAGGLIALGLLVDIVAVLAFRRAQTTVNPLKPETTSELVVRGLYQHTRNPMYLGLLSILLGLAIGFGNVVGVLPVAAFVVSITLTQIKPEERALTARFGDAYRNYCRRVRRWI